MSLEQELQSEKVSHLDLSGFSQVTSGVTVRDTLARMRADKHNTCLIIKDGRLVGIFTDRDVLRKVVTEPAILESRIDDVMTSNPITIHPNSTAAEALKLMDDNHFRNLPAVDEVGTIHGHMTHQTIIHYLAARYPKEVLNRSPLPDLFPKKPEGG